MNILVLHEKYNNRYINAGYTNNSLTAAAAAVVRERIRNNFYEDKDTEKAKLYLDQNKALNWLRMRSNNEYENISVEVLETIE